MATRSSQPSIDRIDSRYVVEQTLGRGGMGAVYGVVDETTGRRVALKQMIVPDGHPLDVARLRFRREFHTMANLRHPRIVEVFDYGIADDHPYYTLEMLDGQDLHDLDKLPFRRACEVLRDVASALAFLHARRLLHRDLATKNVRCTTDGRAKLIDFGVLATTGVAGDVAGTPPYIPPEALYGRPIDHRSDLFGLGALAYRIVTGRHAFPARTLDDLERLWQAHPAPASSLVPDLPPAFDELIASLLALDPMARPSSAAEVIDRLSAIGELPMLPEAEVAHGWIASAALVGRQAEISQLRRGIARAAEGAGRSVLIEAASGSGKTRMLRELEIEGQLGGLCVVRSDSQDAARGPYGVFHALARALLAAAPNEAEAAARLRGPMLARVITSLRKRLAIEPAAPAGDPAEDRMRLQTELTEWVLDVSSRRPMALVIDDIQRCDEASAAVLATLAHRARDTSLVLAATLRTDEPVRAVAAVAAIVDAGDRIRLRGLDETQLGELCRSLFGEVPNVNRLASWLHRVAGGSPLHSLVLARHFVDNGTILYADGVWVIPDDLDRDGVPPALADALAARVHALPPETRALGEALAVFGGPLPLTAIVQLADTRDVDAVFAALDTLAFQEITMQAGDRWQFRHDGLREAFVRGLTDERRRELHRRIGTMLADDPQAGERDLEVGWHLLDGGEPARGIVHLERAGRALYDAQSFADSIRPLEAVLDFLGPKRSRRHLELLHMLLMAGCMADRRCALRHADVCVDAFRRAAGIDVAAGVARVLGRYVGVAIGMLVAFGRWALGGFRGQGPYRAFSSYFVVVGYAATIHSLGFDLERGRAMVQRLDPVAILPNRVPYAAYLLTRNLLHFPRGDTGIVRTSSARLLEILAHDKVSPVREIDRRTGEGGARYMLALLDVMDLEPELDAELERLAGLGLRFFALGADQARVLFHRMRGEEVRAVEIADQVELEFVRLGSVWQIESFMPVVSCLAYGYTRDMIGLRRNIEQLTAMCAEGYLFQGFLDIARGDYLRERGDLGASKAALEVAAALDDFPMVQVHALPALAETLLALGEVDRAREVAAKGVTRAFALETRNRHAGVRAVRALALAEATLGDHASAAARLDESLADVTPRGSPMLTGSLHETRARVALSAGDVGAYELHLAACARQFRATRNPVLISRAQRLEAAGNAGRGSTPRISARMMARLDPAMERSVIGVDAVTTPAPRDLRSVVTAALSGCRGPSERAARALQLVLTETGGATGFLFLSRRDALTLAAPLSGDEPPTAMRDDVSRAIAPVDPDLATVIETGTGTRPWMIIPLALDGAKAPFGAVVVVQGSLELSAPEPGLLVALARELFDAGDVTHARAPSIGG